MRITNIIFLLFLISAFGIGAKMNQSDDNLINSALDNASITLNNLILTKNTDVYTNGLIKILESLVHFIGTGFVEIMRLGINFGKQNPGYFTPEFIFTNIKLCLWLIMISLLIKPLFYLVVFFILIGIWIKDKIKSRKSIVRKR